jgi:hypothetical protein
MSAVWIGVVIFAAAMVAGVRANYLADVLLTKFKPGWNRRIGFRGTECGLGNGTALLPSTSGCIRPAI